MKGYIKFVKQKKITCDGQAIYAIINRHDINLGEIVYHKKWKTWIFAPESDMVFDRKCLLQITNLLLELNASG